MGCMKIGSGSGSRGLVMLKAGTSNQSSCVDEVWAEGLWFSSFCLGFKGSFCTHSRGAQWRCGHAASSSADIFRVGKGQQ